MEGKRIAWCTPLPSKGAGGFRTIIQNARALERCGCTSDFYFTPNLNRPADENQIREWLKDWYDYEPDRVYSGEVCFADTYDLAIATAWDTAAFVADQSCKHKAYFVQDYEPMFFPVGTEYLEAQESYSLGLTPITIGRWLARQCQKMCDKEPFVTDFGADLSVYRQLDTSEKSYAICAIYQPEKPRRASTLLLEALAIVKDMCPELTIYLYGSEQALPANSPFVNLGILPIEQCNLLYNSCLCGISMSTSNPSRIPFEMMASGLPVIDLLLPNNLFDLPSSAVKLTKPNAASLAGTIVDLLKDKQQLKEMSIAGPAYMQSRNIECEGIQFASACKSILEDAPSTHVEYQPINRDVESNANEIMNILARDKRRQVIKEAAVQARPASFPSKQLHISLTGVNDHPLEIRVACWSDPLQKDIVWEYMTPHEEKWECNVLLSEMKSQPSLFHFHFYIKHSDSKEPEFFVSFDKPLILLPVTATSREDFPTECRIPIAGSSNRMECTLKAICPQLEHGKRASQKEQDDTLQPHRSLSGAMRHAARSLFGRRR